MSIFRCSQSNEDCEKTLDRNHQLLLENRQILTQLLERDVQQPPQQQQQQQKYLQQRGAQQPIQQHPEQQQRPVERPAVPQQVQGVHQQLDIPVDGPQDTYLKIWSRSDEPIKFLIGLLFS